MATNNVLLEATEGQTKALPEIGRLVISLHADPDGAFLGQKFGVVCAVDKAKASKEMLNAVPGLEKVLKPEVGILFENGDFCWFKKKEVHLHLQALKWVSPKLRGYKFKSEVKLARDAFMGAFVEIFALARELNHDHLLLKNKETAPLSSVEITQPLLARVAKSSRP